MASNSEVMLNVRNEYIKQGTTLDIDVIGGDDTEQENWIWTSFDENIATVDEDGIVTGVGLGQVTITGYNATSDLKAKAIIHVYRNVEGAITVPEVEEGQSFTVVLKEDGTVWASGLNNNGQLGQGDKVNRNLPVQVKISESEYLINIVKISTGPASTIALTQDGKVYGFGKNEWGELGQGNKTALLYATQIKGVGGEGYLTDIVDISASHGNSYYVNKDGYVYGIGYGADSNLLGNAESLTPILLSKVRDAICVNGGYSNVGVMLSNGSTYLGGHNRFGALGNGGTANSNDLIYVGNDIVEVNPEGYSTYYLKEDGTIWGAGLNDFGQLGTGNTTNQTTFVQMRYDDGEEVIAKQLEAGSRNCIFKSVDDKIYITGYNGYGQLSNGTKTNATYPIIVDFKLK